jgi:hypothetical protein
MPNWCQNTLTIKGKAKDISKLMKQVEITKSEETSEHYAQAFSCHKIIPRPTVADNDWYSWNTSNWGSKWDCNAVQRDDSDWENGSVVYYFDTAWSPIVDVVTQLAKEHKKLLLTYTYYEGGSDYWGEHEYSKGKEVSTDGGELSDAGCERREYLLGDHHNCNDCYADIPCNGEDTKELCAECIEQEENTNKQLWEGEPNEDTAEQTYEVA